MLNKVVTKGDKYVICLSVEMLMKIAYLLIKLQNLRSYVLYVPTFVLWENVTYPLWSTKTSEYMYVMYEFSRQFELRREKMSALFVICITFHSN